MTTTRVRGITNVELARRLRKSSDAMAEILYDFEAVGIAEQQNGLWRLTEHGRREYGGLARLPVIADHDENDNEKGGVAARAA